MNWTQRIAVAAASLFISWQAFTLEFMTWGVYPTIYTINEMSWLNATLIAATFIAKGFLAIITAFGFLAFFVALFDDKPFESETNEIEPKEEIK